LAMGDRATNSAGRNWRTDRTWQCGVVLHHAAGWNALQLTTSAGKPFDLIGYLQCLPPGSVSHEVNLRAAVGRDEPALAIRLIVQRETPEAAEAACSALRRATARKGKTLDPRSLIAAGFMTPGDIALEERIQRESGLAAYRQRRQIELAFKRLKRCCTRPSANAVQSRIANLALRPP
jgi:hypothetical protein